VVSSETVSVVKEVVSTDTVEEVAKAVVETSEKVEKLAHIEDYFRKLPKNQHVSQAKLEEALLRNLEIPEGMTLVDGFDKIVYVLKEAA
jgi:cell envelope opacity-associated protein A